MHHLNLATVSERVLLYVFYQSHYRNKFKDGRGFYPDRVVDRSLVVQEEVEKSIFPTKQIPIPISSKNCSIIGSCNGLLCVNVSDSDFWLWNPVTNKTRCLPQIPIKPFTAGVWHFVHAFGLIPETNEYTIVQIESTRPDGWIASPIIQVYRQSSDAWRIVDNTSIALSDSLSKTQPFELYSLDLHSWTTASSSLNDSGMDVGGAIPGILIHHSRSTSYLNGAFHWTAVVPLPKRPNHIYDEYGDDFCFEGIVSFDHRNEKLKIIDMLSHAMAPYPPTQLGVLNESLCMIARGGNNSAYLWLMNDYGNRESWTNLFLIEETPEIYGCWKSYLLVYGTEQWSVTMYNLATGERKNLSIQREEDESVASFSYFDFVETLLPVEPDSQLVKMGDDMLLDSKKMKKRKRTTIA